MISKQKIYGLIGYPVKHSFSAAMHNAAFSHLGINALYTLFEIKPEDLESFLIERTNLAGFNITIPHKVEARKILERINPIKFNPNTDNIQQDLFNVIISGAINTVKVEDGKLSYWNTDAPGFIKSLENDLGVEPEKISGNVIVFGCGGAGRAVITALSWKQYTVEKIFIFEKNEKQIKDTRKHFEGLPGIWAGMLKEKVEFISQEQIPEKIKGSSLLINTTPVGMKPEIDNLLDKDLLHGGLSVYDVVYNRETQLIKDAKAKGLKASGGLGMLLYQGVLGFNYWAGKDIAPVAIMRQALEGELEKCRI